MNFARDVVDAADPRRPALVAVARDGARSEVAFGEVADRSARLAGTLAARGVGRGDAVMTLIGNRPEWVYAMVACWRLGAAAQPCTEQLRPGDLRARIDRVEPRAIVVDARDVDLIGATGFDGPVLVVPDERLFESEPVPAAELGPEDPALIVFTSGTAGEPNPIRHGARYLEGQHVQAEHWYGARPGDLCWCTAASGWSLSARNAFVAAWLRGAAALLHDGRFDPGERIDLLEREGVSVLCMSPTEYRAIAKRGDLRPLPALRHAVAVDEEGRDSGRVDDQLPGIDPGPKARQRPPHRAGLHRRPDRHSGQMAGLGLPVAVVHGHADRLLPGQDHLGVERLAGGDRVAQGRERAQVAALRDRPVLGG